MEPLKSVFFTIPMGLGSTYLFYVSRWNGTEVSYFTNNATYQTELFFLWLISAAYFFLDFVLMIDKYFSDKEYRKDPNALLYFVHHIIGILSSYMVFSITPQFIKYYIAYMTYELSTPFMNIVNSAYKNKIENWFVKLSQIMFTVLFTLVRIVFGSVLSYKLIKSLLDSGGFIRGIIIFPFCLQLLNYWWYYRILRLWFKKFGCIKTNTMKKIKVDELSPELPIENIFDVSNQNNTESSSSPSRRRLVKITQDS